MSHKHIPKHHVHISEHLAQRGLYYARKAQMCLDDWIEGVIEAYISDKRSRDRLAMSYVATQREDDTDITERGASVLE